MRLNKPWFKKTIEIEEGPDSYIEGQNKHTIQEILDYFRLKILKEGVSITIPENNTVEFRNENVELSVYDKAYIRANVSQKIKGLLLYKSNILLSKV